MKFLPTNATAREARLRRLARREGYEVHKTRWRRGTLDNLGGYRIFDRAQNFAILGFGTSAIWAMSKAS